MINFMQTNDAELYKSAWVNEISSFDRNGLVYEGLDAIMENIFTPVSKLETQHMISNIRIELEDGAKTAHMVTYMLAQHYRPGEAMDPARKGLFGMTTNLVDLVLDDEDGLWKMKRWVMKINWIEGDASIVGLPGN